MKVLISGIGKRNVLIRLLKSVSPKFGIELIGADASDIPPARFEVDRFFSIPHAREQSFTEKYLAKIKELEIDVCMTLVDPEIPLLGDIEEKSLVRAFHPTRYVSLICEDKYQFFCEAEKVGISTLKTFLTPPDTLPFIRKDRWGSSASGFAVYTEKIISEDFNEFGKFIYQPYCAGRHFCIDLYVSYYSGKLIDLCIKEVLEKKNGESFLLKSVKSKEIVFFVERVCRWLPFRGIINFDIYEERGELKIMEINCRIGGNYPASHAFGCDLLSLLCSEISNSAPCTPKYSDYEPDQLVAKYFGFSLPKGLF